MILNIPWHAAIAREQHARLYFPRTGLLRGDRRAYFRFLTCRRALAAERRGTLGVMTSPGACPLWYTVTTCEERNITC